MFGAILKATNRAFQKGITFCRSIYVKKVMKLLPFIFEQPSYKKRVKNNNLLKLACSLVFIPCHQPVGQCRQEKFVKTN